MNEDHSVNTFARGITFHTKYLLLYFLGARDKRKNIRPTHLRIVQPSRVTQLINFRDVGLLRFEELINLNSIRETVLLCHNAQPILRRRNRLSLVTETILCYVSKKRNKYFCFRTYWTKHFMECVYWKA